MRARAFVVLLGLALPAVVLLPFAAADAPKRARPGAASRADAGASEAHDPDNVTAISQAMATLVKGNERYLAKDYPGAIDLYRKAISLAPRNALGHYLLGEGQLAVGNASEAEAAFKQAEELTDTRNPPLRSHVLFVVADVYERQKKWDQAKVAWQAYNDHAAKYADAGAFPASGAARLKVIDEVMKLEARYVDVRARIAAEKEAAADAGAAKAEPAKR